MKNITLAIDEHVLAEVREVAARRRTTVNAMVREFLGRIATEEGRIETARRRLKQLMDRSTAELGPNYAWSREELYEDRMFPRHEHSDLRGRRKKA